MSTIKSFYSATHYEWAAHERSGIALSYLFGIAATFCTLVFIGLYIGTIYLGMDFSNLLKNEFGNFAMLSMFLQWLGQNVFLIAFIIIMTSFSITMSLINLAIIIAVIATPLNFLLKAKLTFDQLLRVTVYAMIPAFIITGIISLLTATYNPTLMTILLVISMALYEIYGIICAKLYLND